MNRTKGVSLAKGPVGIIGIILLAGGILGLLFGSTDFTTHATDGTVNGGTWLGIEGNGWTWVLFGGTGLVLLLSAPMHWGAKTTALIGGVVMAIACALAVVDGNDVLGIFAANTATMIAFGAAAVALLIVAMMPRLGRRREVVAEDERTDRRARRGRFSRRVRDRRVEEPVDRDGRFDETRDRHEPVGATSTRERSADTADRPVDDAERRDGTTERPVGGTTERRA
jgi:hypothetical protein